MSAYRLTTRLRLAWIKKRHGDRPIHEVLKHELALLDPKDFRLSSQLAVAQLSVVSPAPTLTRLNDQLIRLLELLEEDRQLDYTHVPLTRSVVPLQDFLKSSQHIYEDPVPRIKAMRDLIGKLIKRLESSEAKASTHYAVNTHMLRHYLGVVQELIHSLLKYTP